MADVTAVAATKRPGIADLDEVVESLPKAEKKLFRRLFHLSAVIGELDPPQEMHPWLEKQFGSVAGTRQQKIIKVTNMVTFEGALFNRLRASRPIDHDPPSKLREQYHLYERKQIGTECVGGGF